MSKKVKVVKLQSKERTTRREALVTYNGEKMTRVEREAKLREQVKPAEDKPVVTIRKGTKVAEAAPVRNTATTPKKEVSNSEVKKVSTGNEWYVKALKALCEFVTYTVKTMDIIDAEDEEIGKWELVSGLFCKA